MFLSIVFGVSILTGVVANLRIHHANSVNDAHEDAVIPCVRAVREKYFLQQQNIEIIARMPRDSVIESFEGSAIVIRTAANFQYPDYRQMITKYAVIFLERPNYVEDVKMLSALEKFDPQGRYIISVNNEVHLSSLNEYITKIIGYLASIERWNVVILMNDLEVGGTRVLSYTLYSSGNCARSPKVMDHGECSSALSNLFPVVVNLHKCPLRLVTTNVLPYSIIDSKNNQISTHGIESNGVNLIVEKFNAVAEISVQHSTNTVREIIQNRTGDVAWGGLIQYTVPGTVFSQTHFHAKTFVIIPESRRISSWMNLVLPFQTEVWITLGVVIALPLVVKVIAPCVRRAFAVEYLLAGFTGTGISRSPSKLSQRLYYLTWLIGGYIVIQGYLGNLTGILTSPAQIKQIQTLEELEEKQISIYGAELLRSQIKETYPKMFRNWKVTSVQEYFAYIEKMERGEDGVATFVSEIRIPNITHGRELNFHVIPEAFNILPLALLMPNSSVFLEGSNSVIERVSAAGLFHYWKKNYIQQTLKGASRAQQKDDNSMLSLSDLTPVFLMVCVVYGISIIIFILERIIAKLRPNTLSN